VLVALLFLGACQVPSRTADPSTDQLATTESTTPAATTAAPVESTPPSSPAVEKKRVTATQEIPFQTRNVNDSTLAQGTQKVRTKGVPGIKTITYEVTLTGGVETDRKVVAETVTKAPVTQVVAVGTKKPQRQCDPNYSGACVPIASDVDCAGGSGDGPAYVQGPVTVIGDDIYDLDRDGNGIGCE
jgi:resuscitation-promoting factor RpfB